MIRALKIIIVLLSTQVECMHYKGGTITWKPTNAYSIADPVEILITEKHSWTLSRYACDSNTINTLGLYYDSTSGSTTAFPTVECQPSSVSLCSPLTSNDHITLCTDFSNNWCLV
ncbi:unnamed protein product [Didymodactylos carnosus]|uniref:Uncharacterized protein n=1 Tax=Didymodactylos carnosus TaxID=1234261 RepID=A0A8S2IBU5_9BILA|nr:unnamed protein product [Didymodactylos carnosus]CAF3718213.1 unnamed protein product [Didymodactylos carnosus]